MQAQNNFIGGLNTDINKYNVPNNVLTDCINGITITNNGNEFVLQNRNSNSFQTTLTPGFIPLGITEYGGISYIISFNPKTKEGEIGSVPSPINELSDFLTNDRTKIQIFDSYTVYKDAFKDLTTVNATNLKEQLFKEPVKVYLWKVTKDNKLNPGDMYAIAYRLLNGNQQAVDDLFKNKNKFYKVDLYLEVNDKSIKLTPSNGFFPNIKYHTIGDSWTDLVYNSSFVKPYIHNNSGRYYMVISVKDMSYFDVAHFEEKTTETDTIKKFDLICKGDISTECKFTGFKIKLEAYDNQNTQVRSYETFIKRTAADTISVEVGNLDANFFSMGPGHMLYEITPFSDYNINYNLTKKGKIVIKQFIAQSTSNPTIDTFNITEAGLKFRISQLGNILAGNQNKIERCYIEFYDVFADVSTIYTPSVPNTDEVTLPLTITDKAYNTGKVGGFYEASEINNVVGPGGTGYGPIVKFTNRNVSSNTTLNGTKFIRDKAFYLVKLTFQSYDYDNGIPVSKDFTYFRTISVNTSNYIRVKDILPWWNTNRNVSHYAQARLDYTDSPMDYVETNAYANQWIGDHLKLNGSGKYTRGILYSKSNITNTAGSTYTLDDAYNVGQDVVNNAHKVMDQNTQDHRLQFSKKSFTGNMRNQMSFINQLNTTIPGFHFKSSGKIRNGLTTGSFQLLANTGDNLTRFTRQKRVSDGGPSNINPSSTLLDQVSNVGFAYGTETVIPPESVKECFNGMMLLGEQSIKPFTFNIGVSGYTTAFIEPDMASPLVKRIFTDYGAVVYDYNQAALINRGGAGVDRNKYKIGAIGSATYPADAVPSFVVDPVNPMGSKCMTVAMAYTWQVGKVCNYMNSRLSLYDLNVQQQYQLQYSVYGEMTNDNMLCFDDVKMRDRLEAKILTYTNGYVDILAPAVISAFPILNLSTIDMPTQFELSRAKFTKEYESDGWEKTVSTLSNSITRTQYWPATEVTTPNALTSLGSLTNETVASMRTIKNPNGDIYARYIDVQTEPSGAPDKWTTLNINGSVRLRTRGTTHNMPHSCWDLQSDVIRELEPRYTTLIPNNGSQHNGFLRLFHVEGWNKPSHMGGIDVNLATTTDIKVNQPIIFSY